jgi:hypothetical protein
MVYCTNCNTDSTGLLSIYQGGTWKNILLDCTTPVPPTPGTNVEAFAGCGVDSTRQVTTGFNVIPAGYSMGRVVDSIVCIPVGAAVNCTLKFWYGASANSAGTAIVTSPSAITSLAGTTKFSGVTLAQPTIPKGNTIWVTTYAVTTACARIAVLFFGHSY